MKRFFSVLLIVLSLLIGFQRGIIVLHYQMNRAYFEKVYCENKDMPAMSCKGVCYIKKIIQKSEDKSSNASKVMYQKADMLLSALILLYNTAVGFELARKVPAYLDVLYSNPLIEVLVPPPVYVANY